MIDFSQFDTYCDASDCVICEIPLDRDTTYGGEQGIYTAHCPNCGKYRIAEDAYEDLVSDWRTRKSKKNYFPLLSHKVRLRQRPDDPTFVRSEWLQEVFDGAVHFPSAIEQIENLVIYLAENLGPGESRLISYKNSQAVVGAISRNAFGWVLKSATDKKWVQGTPHKDIKPFELLDGSLTVDGWHWYSEIGRHRHSNIAFMAMKYNDKELDSVVDKYFVPAVAQAGFKLHRLDTEPKAGILDNRLRVEIRRSRLLIADLTHGNHGAYWEAGFADGLGLPVIYCCKKSEIKEIHFDTRNCQIILWEKNNLTEAANELKAIIRNTLPDEAVLEDPE